jgi:NAD(P)-dependent dehydrogenase (short-subunit alcohol dehydrogenase family)
MNSTSAPCLAGRVAIVTGANSGIGYGIAKAFAREGAKVVVAGRTEERNNVVVEEIRSAGGEAIAVKADVMREEDVVALVERTVEVFGRLDICVANSGGTESGVTDIENMDTKMWRDVVCLNLDSVFVLYREAIRKMIPAGSGVLIGVSSVASIRSTGSAFHYSAAKAGVNALSMYLAEHLGPKGIRINTIIPGFIETAATAPMLANEIARRGVEKRIPLRRIGQPDEVGELAVFLASDRSSFITGQQFVIDGGQTQRMVSDPPAS